MNLIMVTEGNKCTMSDAKSSDEVLTFNVTDKRTTEQKSNISCQKVFKIRYNGRQNYENI